MNLECFQCGHIMVLTEEQQTRLLDEINLPAAVAVVECVCGRTQHVLRARPKRDRREQVEGG